MKPREIKKFRDSYSKYEKHCVFEGYRLAVLFDEKDMVKKYGGRWDADEQTWWMPENRLLDDAGVGSPSNGSLVRDVLNDNKMIMGPYGEYKGPCKGNATVFSLLSIHDKTCYTIQWWSEEDAVQFAQSLPDGTFGQNCPEVVWYTIENARTRWNELTSSGYNRIEKQTPASVGFIY